MSLVRSADLLAAVRHFLHHFLHYNKGLGKTIWVAYSGGLDSHVLLSLCHALRSELNFSLRAIHINHGISPHAASWEQHCKAVCTAYQIDYVARSVQLDLAAGISVEEAARIKRYAVFAECIQTGDILLTAHHQDDQAETTLLQLLRGAGPKGLAAMPTLKPLADGWHGRPLLTFPRDVLQDYAEAHRLCWVEDESNLNLKLTRNYIRHAILPLLKQRWPSVTATLARSAAHCSESQVLLEEFALDVCIRARGSRENTLSVLKLAALRPDQQRLVLRSWIQQQGFMLPDARKMASIQQNVLTAASDRRPCVRWQGVEMRRYRDDLFVLATLPPHDSKQVLAWQLEQPLALAELGTLQAALVSGQGLSADIKQVSVRFRQGGELACLPERGRHTLKNLLQEWGVLPWERDRIPLIFIEDMLVGVVGYFIDSQYAAKSGELGWQMKLQR